jgi:hypothetical protein
VDFVAYQNKFSAYFWIFLLYLGGGKPRPYIRRIKKIKQMPYVGARLAPAQQKYYHGIKNNKINVLGRGGACPRPTKVSSQNKNKGH